MSDKPTVPQSTEFKRSIRSFVKRTGRLTSGQRYALDHFWSLYGLDFELGQTLDLATIFPGLNCYKLEIGFGNGDSLVQMAAQDSACGYIGIEVHEPGVGHCLNQIHQQGLKNLKLISHDAIEVLESMIPARCLDRLFLFFPDPWHKKKHHKRRIVNQQFRDLMIVVMKPGAILHMATDWQDYAQHMSEDLYSDNRFKNLGDSSGYSAKPDYRPTTKFERRGQKLGHGVWDLLFKVQ
jgi:tRNA (guanine-N7-)-methyltransferase